MDELDKKILTQLKEGRRSFKKIADTIGITENTVRSRVRRMEEEGAIKISAYVDADKNEEVQVLLIGIRTSTMDYIAKGEEISRLPGVISVAVVTGRFDLIVKVALPEGQHKMLDFLKDELSRIDSIETIETFVVYKGFGLMIPWLE